MSHPLPIRRVRQDLSHVPRNWAGDERLTHVLNGLYAVFPDGEMFFCRSVRAFAPGSGVSAEELRGFYGQESNHGAAHREAFRMLEAQGYEIESWLAWYRSVAYGRMEARTPPILRLASTAALEHLTATLADVAFDPEDIIVGVHPEMRFLTQWHAAEEIEHRAVAFDVLQSADPRLVVRWAGMAIALATLLYFGMSAMNHLARQDGLRGTRRRFLRDLLRRRGMVRRLLRYGAPSFHPDEDGPHEVARAFLAELDQEAA